MNFEAYKEIHESYKQMKQTIASIKQYEDEIVKLFSRHKELILLGCGSSYWACLSIARSLSKHTDKNVQVWKAAEVAMAPQEYVKGYQHPMLLIPSRSGESKELLEAIQAFQAEYSNAAIFAVTEFEENTVKEIADLHIAIPFAEEISVCQTRSFNCLYTAMMAVVSIISNHDILADFDNYLSKAQRYYEDADVKMKKLAEYMDEPQIVVLSSGIQYGAAIEGAYIIMEMAQHLTNYFQILEYRHGPIVTANPKTCVFMISTTENNRNLEAAMGLEIKKQGAMLIVCGSEREIQEADQTFMMEPYCEEVRGIYATMLLQHLAYHLACKWNRNPDRPGNLVKYITY